MLKKINRDNKSANASVRKFEIIQCILARLIQPLIAVSAGNFEDVLNVEKGIIETQVYKKRNVF